ncbi:MAG: YdeI/OmpD-associated family protein [Pseudomonadota bacterium]
MTGYISFEGRIEPMEWGKSTYTVLRLPDEVARELAAQGAKRVEGEIEEHPVNLAMSRAPVVDGVFLWAGKNLLDQLDVVPGQQLDVRLRKAPDDHVDVPDDVTARLRAAGLSEEWAALTAGKQRGLLHQISTAKRPETRAKRIDALISGLGVDDD